MRDQWNRVTEKKVDEDEIDVISPTAQYDLIFFLRPYNDHLTSLLSSCDSKSNFAASYVQVLMSYIDNQIFYKHHRATESVYIHRIRSICWRLRYHPHIILNNMRLQCLKLYNLLISQI